LATLADKVRDQIIEEVKDSINFSITVDETKDIISYLFPTRKLTNVS
jgi:hypothetical protein